MFFDPHNKVFGFDLWNPWDKEKKKPVNISVFESSDPRGAWNTYPVPAPGGVDGGGIGFSKKWIGYSFPGGKDNTFVLKMAEVKAGNPATVYHFAGSLGHPVFTQDDTEDLYFFHVRVWSKKPKQNGFDKNNRCYWLSIEGFGRPFRHKLPF